MRPTYNIWLAAYIYNLALYALHALRVYGSKVNCKIRLYTGLYIFYGYGIFFLVLNYDYVQSIIPSFQIQKTSNFRRKNFYIQILYEYSKFPVTGHLTRNPRQNRLTYVQSTLNVKNRFSAPL